MNGLTELEKLKVVRPVFGSHELDSNDLPIIHKPQIDTTDWENMQVLNYRNLSIKADNSKTLALMFCYDKELIRLWNNPLKKIPLFQTCMAVATPDYSVYPTMNINEIRHNIYQARWLGCLWQDYGCTVFPTIGWATENTYDICFGGVEKGSPVVISTLGCQEHPDVFLNGFEEMKKRIEPPIIIIYGDMIPGMTGRFIHFRYESAFSTKMLQMRMKEVSQIFCIEEVC